MQFKINKNAKIILRNNKPLYSTMTKNKNSEANSYQIKEIINKEYKIKE